MSPGFTGGLLDRADALRHDPEGLAAARSDWRARVLRLDRFEPELDGEGRLGWSSLAETPEDAELILLGFDESRRPHFAAYLPGMRAPAGRSPRLFALLDQFAPGEAATYAAARSVLDWHSRHQFCANCGTQTALFRAGWGRACPNCKAEHFPRVDPVVIMIAEHDGRALLGRQPAFPPGRYSALAGFLEPGESIEEAVAREIMEEAGVRVTDVRYIASQPWPFPSSLMIGCHAEALSTEIHCDDAELEDCRWFSRQEVLRMLAGNHPESITTPISMAIASHLIRAWVYG